MAQARTLQASSEVRFDRFLASVYLVVAVGMVITELVATSVSKINSMNSDQLRIGGWSIFLLW
jgi:hypothetical protein